MEGIPEQTGHFSFIEKAVLMQKGEGTETLKTEIDRILEEARQNGKLAELSIKYFGTDLTKR